MAGSQVKIEIKVTDDQITSALQALQQRANNLTPVFKSIGEHLVRTTWERFDAQHAPDGTPWQPIKDSSLAIAVGMHAGIDDRDHTKKGALRAHILRRIANKKILIQTSRLRDSIAYRATGDGVAVGTNVIYAAIHQFGGQTKPHVILPVRKKALAWFGGAHPVKKVNHPGSKIPARPFLGISAEDHQAIIDIIMQDLLP